MGAVLARWHGCSQPWIGVIELSVKKCNSRCQMMQCPRITDASSTAMSIINFSNIIGADCWHERMHRRQGAARTHHTSDFPPRAQRAGSGWGAAATKPLLAVELTRKRQQGLDLFAGAMAPRKAVVLVDPVTEWRQVVAAASDTHHVVVAIQMPDVALPDKFKTFLPSAEALRDAGVAHVLPMDQRDVFSISREVQLLAAECGLEVAGVIPLSEVAVEVTDLIASCLGLSRHNPLDLLTARRDKGVMKAAVSSAGLRIAKYARVDGSLARLRECVEHLSLSYPIVVKTPSGMSTTDVCICSDEGEAASALQSIVGGTGPDGRTVDAALLEEYIGGTEFAVNLMAIDYYDDDNLSNLLVTDMWKYRKTDKARYDSAEICNPHDHPELISYARSVARAVGIKYGAAHVELKARQDERGQYTDPIMIEVGARLSGGRKSTMAREAVGGWDPFAILIESHCGVGQGCRQVRITSGVGYLVPDRFVRHVFLPVERSGRVKEVRSFDDASLLTVYSKAILIKAGDVVEETTDILSCAGFVWLVGEKEDVDRDTEAVLSSFSLVME